MWNMICLLLLLFSILNLAVGDVNLWTDVGFVGEYDFEDLDESLGFMMDNYKIIVFEKCAFEKDPHERTEDVFQRLVSRSRELRPNSTAKILFYWNVAICYKCYYSIDYLQTRPDLWFNDTNGYPIKLGGHHRPFFDYRIPEALDLWVSSAANVVEQCDGKCQGVWLDGITYTKYSNCQVKSCGEDGESCCEVTEETEREWNEAKHRAIGALRDRLHEINPSNILIGNDVGNAEFYNSIGHHDRDTLAENIDVLDGFARDHFMIYGEVDWRTHEKPYVYPEAIESFVKIRNTVVQANKTLMVRGAPGPVKIPYTVGPIGDRPFNIPNLQLHYPYEQPRTIAAVQQSYKDLLNFPLAVYLCGLAAPNVYFSYTIGHTVKTAVPCFSHPDHCLMPQDLDQLFNNDPGAPLSEPIWSGRTCTRQFENYGVSVNIEDEDSVMWIPWSLPSNSSTP